MTESREQHDDRRRCIVQPPTTKIKEKHSNVEPNPSMNVAD
jgi:hypothetical protein